MRSKRRDVGVLLLGVAAIVTAIYFWSDVDARIINGYEEGYAAYKKEQEHASLTMVARDRVGEGHTHPSLSPVALNQDSEVSAEFEQTLFAEVPSPPSPQFLTHPILEVTEANFELWMEQVFARELTAVSAESLEVLLREFPQYSQHLAVMDFEIPSGVEIETVYWGVTQELRAFQALKAEVFMRSVEGMPRSPKLEAAMNEAAEKLWAQLPAYWQLIRKVGHLAE